MNLRREPGERRCAFCGRFRQEVRRLVAGPSVFICDRCISVCNQLLTDRASTRSEDVSAPRARPARPRDIKERLDEWVVSQDRAKRMLAVAVYNHLKRTRLRDAAGGVELTKANIILIGPPGTGKTHLARTLARLLDVPFAMVDATPLTQAGYVGEDVESVIAKLLRASNNSVERAQRGIIYIDEIDKLARRPGHDRDVSGEGVQQGLLKILEGKRVVVRIGLDRSGLGGEPLEVDTSNVLFIGGGTFDGLLRGMAARQRARATGFASYLLANDGRGPHDQVLPEDLQRFGLLPEFIGRFPIRVLLEPLDEESLVRILVEPRDALFRQYQRLFALEGAQLEHTPDGLHALARRALQRNSGARGLRTILEELLLESMFDLPTERGGRYVVDAQAVEQGTVQKIQKRTAA